MYLFLACSWSVLFGLMHSLVSVVCLCMCVPVFLSHFKITTYLKTLRTFLVDLKPCSSMSSFFTFVLSVSQNNVSNNVACLFSPPYAETSVGCLQREMESVSRQADLERPCSASLPLPAQSLSIVWLINYGWDHRSLSSALLYWPTYNTHGQTFQIWSHTPGR